MLPDHPIVGDVRSRVRRLVSLAVPPFILIALVLVGRFAARAPQSEIAIVGAASAAPMMGDAVTSYDASNVAPSDADVTNSADTSSSSTSANPAATDAEAAVSALEVLGDGAVIVDLNLATDEELRRLPGIGPARAHAILELRKRLGRLKGVDDLARIKGFGRAMLRRLRPLTRASSPRTGP